MLEIEVTNANTYFGFTFTIDISSNIYF